MLEGAKEKGPFTHAEHVRLYEQLGIAYAYLDKKEAAVDAFETMLSLDRTRAISYTLSPKVTFLFEQARNQVADRPAPSVDLSWPRDLAVEDTVPVDVEVLTDPGGFLTRAQVFFRKKGVSEFESASLELPGPGAGAARVELPAVAAGDRASAVLQLYLVAKDQKNNEVLFYGAPNRPREVSLVYQPPEPWYDRWWVWAIAGSVVAAGAGAAVFMATQEPPSTIDGTFRVIR